MLLCLLRIWHPGQLAAEAVKTLRRLHSRKSTCSQQENDKLGRGIRECLNFLVMDIYA